MEGREREGRGGDGRRGEKRKEREGKGKGSGMWGPQAAADVRGPAGPALAKDEPDTRQSACV